MDSCQLCRQSLRRCSGAVTVLDDGLYSPVEYAVCHLAGESQEAKRKTKVSVSVNEYLTREQQHSYLDNTTETGHTYLRGHLAHIFVIVV